MAHWIVVTTPYMLQPSNPINKHFDATIQRTDASSVYNSTNLILQRISLVISQFSKPGNSKSSELFKHI